MVRKKNKMKHRRKKRLDSGDTHAADQEQTHRLSSIRMQKLAQGKLFARVAFICAFAFIGVSLLMLSRAATTPPPAFDTANAPTGYSLIWGDEFSDTSVDSTKWNLRDKSNYGTGGNEDQCYYARNATESGGLLHITAKRETTQCGGKNPDGPDNTYYWTSAFLTTTAASGKPLTFSFKQGYVEARIKMPKGNIFWPAFWLVGGAGAPGWPDYGEMDITEVAGGRPDITMGTFHYSCTDPDQHCQTSPKHFNLLANSATATSNTTLLTPQNFSTYNGVTSSRFIRYGLLWEPDRITWYIDGKPFRTLTTTELITYNPDGSIYATKSVSQLGTPDIPLSTVFGYEHTIDLNLSLGGTVPQGSGGYTGGEISTGGYNDGNLAATLPDTMEVDYVRVFQKTSTPSDTTAPSVSITSPVGGTTISGTINATASASDNVGVSRVEFYVDGLLQSTDSASPYSFALNSTGFTNSQHSLTAKAFDAAGNSATSTVVTITVSNSPSSPPVTFQPEDINQDGVVNLLDFSLLSSKFGQTTNLGRTDINGDGRVNLLDFSLLAAKM